MKNIKIQNSFRLQQTCLEIFLNEFDTDLDLYKFPLSRESKYFSVILLLAPADGEIVVIYQVDPKASFAR